jgi:ketosteroid isomerase-like protein
MIFNDLRYGRVATVPLLLLILLASDSAVAQTPGTQAQDLSAVLTKVEAAQTELVRGRPDPFKALWSHGDDVTLIGGLGGSIEKGWGRVSERLDWVASQYSAGTRQHEEVSRVVSGNLAYVVQREVIRFRIPVTGRESVQELRATMVLRLESGGWRIIHRHADAQTAREPTR